MPQQWARSLVRPKCRPCAIFGSGLESKTPILLEQQQGLYLSGHGLWYIPIYRVKYIMLKPAPLEKPERPTSDIHLGIVILLRSNGDTCHQVLETVNRIHRTS